MTTWVKRLNFPMQGYEEPVLVGVDPESRERISRCREGVEYKIDPKRDNNADFHRLVMRLLRDCYEAQDIYQSEEAHRIAVKLAIGWVEDEVVIQPPNERKHRAAMWCRETAEVWTSMGNILLAIADLLEEPVTQLVTRPLSFDKCDQAEREEFFRRLKEFAGPVIGWERVESYEGQL